jgi:tetratricopeptide (TPR) repeat protein
MEEFSMKRQWGRFVAAAIGTFALSLLLVSCGGNPQKARLKYLHKGDAYMSQKQYASAAIEYRNALKVDPRYGDAYFALAKADLAQGDPRGSYQALTQAISVDPGRADIRILRAELLSSSSGEKDLDQGVEDVKYVLQQDPKNAGAHIVYGLLLFKQHQYGQSLQEYAKASTLAPNDSAAYLGIARADLVLNNMADTELNLKKAIQVDPTHAAAAYMDLAALYLKEKNLDQAQQTLQDGIKADPTAVPLYIDLAVLFESQGKKPDADGVLTNLSTQMPKSVDAALAIGDFYRQAKMDDRALAEYQRALSIDSRNLAAKERIENLYLQKAQTADAAKMDDDLLRQAPDNVSVRVNHGRVLMLQGKLADAIQVLQKVVSDAGTYPEGHYYLAMAYIQSNDFAQANSELQQTLRVAPSQPMALTALVNLNFRQGKYSVAQLYAEELLQQNQANPDAHLLLGHILLKLGQTKQAGDEFAEANKLAPNNPSVHDALGLFYAEEKNSPQSDAEFKLALQEDPSNVGVLSDYVNLLMSQKQQAKAIAAVTSFVAQNPNESAAHFLMGQMYMVQNNQSAALSETQKALQLDSKSLDAYLQMGQIYKNQGNDGAAIQAYEHGLALGPSAPIVTEIGNIYQSEGDLSKATDQFQKALDMDPNFAVAANNLAWIYAEQGQNLDVALELARKAKAQQPEVSSFTDTLAWVMFRRGDYSGALPLLQDCVKKVPDSAEFHYHLGMVLVADGQKTEGKAQLQAALQMKLDDQDAQQARKALSR